MQRVVVIGDYSYYDSYVNCDSIQSESDIEKVISRNANSLPKAIEIYKSEYDKIYNEYKSARSKNIEEYIGSEVSINELEKFKS
jgi:hypothetical protein